MRKKSITSFLLVIAALAVLAACSKEPGNAGSTAATPPAAPAQATAAPATSAPEAAPAPAAETVEVVDSLGRKVTIPAPDKLERIYCDSTNSLVVQYILAPDTFTASPSKFKAEDLPFVLENVIGLPSYGTLSGANGVLDYEAIKAADVQLILSSAMNPTEADIETADALQEQLDIPVFVVSTSMDYCLEGLTLLGEALGRQERAAELVAYFSGIVDRVSSKVAAIPDEKKPTLYYAEGKDGLATEPGNSHRSMVFNVCGAKNVATVEALSGFGQAGVSMEAVLGWDPEVIVVQNGTGAYEIITTGEDWATVNAVKNGRVYEMPSTPFGWADRPPGHNRFIGILWLANILYPEEMGMDFTQEVIDYYKLVYSVDITAEDVDRLLVNAGGSK